MNALFEITPEGPSVSQGIKTKTLDWKVPTGKGAFPESIKLNISVSMGTYSDQQISSFLKISDIVLIVYAVDRPSSLNSVQHYLDLVEESCRKNVTKALVGNKCDLAHKE